MKTGRHLPLALIAALVLAGAASGTAFAQQARPVRELEVTSRIEGSTAVVSAIAQNNGVHAVTGGLRWSLNGSIVRGSGLALELAPGKSAESHTAFRVYEGENVAACEARFEDGTRILRRQRVYGQEMTTAPITVDGNLTDWNDPPVVRLRPSKQEYSPLDDDQLQAEVRIAWTPETLYIGADVTDLIPCSAADRLDLFLGPCSDTTQSSMTSVCLSVSCKEPAVFARQIPTNNGLAAPPAHQVDGARAAAVTTATGYRLEASIPIAALGINPSTGRSLAFDMQLQTDMPGFSTGTATLFWNGGDIAAVDPNAWGRAVILPNPETKPPTHRIQLFGGATPRKISDAATTDTRYLTPVPIEHLHGAIHLPPSLVLAVPLRGSVRVGGAYGYENRSWTHQTIDNAGSANDFFAIDFDVAMRTPVYAAAPGNIVTSGRRNDSYGNYMVVDHGEGFHTIYAHLDELKYQVDKGQPEVHVERGDLLGYSGRSGTNRPHLHFAVHRDARISHSGASVGGLAVIPEPLGGYFGIRAGQVLDVGTGQ